MHKIADWYKLEKLNQIAQLIFFKLYTFHIISISVKMVNTWNLKPRYKRNIFSMENGIIFLFLDFGPNVSSQESRWKKKSFSDPHSIDFITFSS